MSDARFPKRTYSKTMKSMKVLDPQNMGHESQPLKMKETWVPMLLGGFSAPT